MTTSFDIRIIGSEYSARAVDLVLPIQQLEFNIPITAADQPDLLDIDEYYHSKGGCFWGAFAGEQLVGTIAMLYVGHHTGVIRKMFVAKHYRGKEYGIATSLLQTLVAFAKKNGLTHLYLGTIDVLKAALRFYERNGFTPVEKSMLPEWFPLMAGDNTFYRLELLLQSGDGVATEKKGLTRV